MRGIGARRTGGFWFPSCATSGVAHLAYLYVSHELHGLRQHLRLDPRLRLEPDVRKQGAWGAREGGGGRGEGLLTCAHKHPEGRQPGRYR